MSALVEVAATSDGQSIFQRAELNGRSYWINGRGGENGGVVRLWDTTSGSTEMLAILHRLEAERER